MLSRFSSVSLRMCECSLWKLLLDCDRHGRVRYLFLFTSWLQGDVLYIGKEDFPLSLEMDVEIDLAILPEL